ncbi:MAG: amidohydrolase family protein [Acidimicrobiia bacterium]|nr:amidohydrolase family protein [Acidimicrobiia bacterium]
MDLVRPWFEAARALIPEGAVLWDAHTHTGQNDPDGVLGTAWRLIDKLQSTGHAGAVVTTSHDPDGYPAANDRVLDEAQRSGGMLIPFLRVDPNLGTTAAHEVVRSLDGGHRGIKLHPRAEQFRLADPSVDPILRIAAERRVPVLIHAGRGISSLGRDAADLCEEIPGLRLVLAHAAISDLSWLGRTAHNVPGLYFDTAWWDITDLLALFAWVPPGRIVYASDTPYGHPALAVVLTMRAAIAGGYNRDQLTGLFGGTLQYLLTGTDGGDLGPPPGEGSIEIDPGLLRLHSNLHTATVRAFARQDATEAVSLARLGCEVPADDQHADLYAAIRSTLDHIDPAAPRGIVRPLIVLSAASLTPGVPPEKAES